MNIKLNDQFDRVLENELVSQFYFTIGMLLLKFENKLSVLDLNTSSSEAGISKKFFNQELAAFMCLIKSINLSKPNSLLPHQEHIHTSKLTSNQQITNDLLKLFHRDSCWRYSIIGNWLKFVLNKYFSNNQIEFLEQLKMFAQKTKVKLILIYFWYFIWLILYSKDFNSF